MNFSYIYAKARFELINYFKNTTFLNYDALYFLTTLHSVLIFYTGFAVGFNFFIRWFKVNEKCLDKREHVLSDNLLVSYVQSYTSHSLFRFTLVYCITCILQIAIRGCSFVELLKMLWRNLSLSQIKKTFFIFTELMGRSIVPHSNMNNAEHVMSLKRYFFQQNFNIVFLYIFVQSHLQLVNSGFYIEFFVLFLNWVNQLLLSFTPILYLNVEQCAAILKKINHVILTIVLSKLSLDFSHALVYYDAHISYNNFYQPKQFCYITLFLFLVGFQISSILIRLIKTFAWFTNILHSSSKDVPCVTKFPLTSIFVIVFQIMFNFFIFTDTVYNLDLSIQSFKLFYVRVKLIYRNAVILAQCFDFLDKKAGCLSARYYYFLIRVSSIFSFNSLANKLYGVY